MVTINDIRAAVYREEDAENPLVKKISGIPGMRSIPCSGENEFPGVFDKLREEGYASKEVIVFREFQGRIYQKCPGSRNVICCNYALLNISFDCLYNCTYCFLNSYLNSYGIVQFVNIFPALEGIDFRNIASNTDGVIRIGTGEYTDSLMMDEITGISRYLISRTAPEKKIFLELKTKSCNVSHLLDIPSRGNTVISWSLNTPGFIEEYEEGTAGLEERLEAAAKASEAGFLTGYHFDPMILEEKGDGGYGEVVRDLFRRVDPERIAWISLGCFRYSPGFKPVIAEKFPGEKLTLGELFPGVDGKFRYLKRRRVETYREMVRMIREFSDKPFLYLCMETGDVWEEVFGRQPESSDHLEKIFSYHLTKNFLS